MKSLIQISLFSIFSSIVCANPEKIALRDLIQGEKTDGAYIYLHRPEKPNGSAIVICPGGGYRGLVMGAEGHGIAKWLNGHGITGVVLQYRLPKGRSFILGRCPAAIRLVRHRGKEWGLNGNRIGIMGFSAGGHLASTAATHFPKFGQPPAETLRPDFLPARLRRFDLPRSDHGQAHSCWIQAQLARKQP